MDLPEVVPDSSLEAAPGRYHSDKEAKYAVGTSDYNGDYNNGHYDSGLIPVTSVHSFKIDDTGQLVPPGSAGGSSGRKKICGLRPKLFWLLLGVGLVVIIASVAGGVGGGMMAAQSRKASNAEASATSPIGAHKSSSAATATKTSPKGTTASDGGKSTNSPVHSTDTASSGGNSSGEATGSETSQTASSTGKQKDANKSTASNNSPAQKTVTTQTIAVSTTTKEPATTPTKQAESTTEAEPTTNKAVPATTSSKTTAAAPAPAPTFLNNQTYTATGFAFQAFSGSDYSGKVSDVIRDEGFLDLSFSSNSYVWLPNGADCCITFCSDKATSVDAVASTAPFSKSDGATADRIRLSSPSLESSATAVIAAASTPTSATPSPSSAWSDDVLRQPPDDRNMTWGVTVVMAVKERMRNSVKEVVRQRPSHCAVSDGQEGRLSETANEVNAHHSGSEKDEAQSRRSTLKNLSASGR
ncbi:uncharacterized protein SPSK_01633 [Sporothrix schenckii 1099-18]|uniref:Uncharacterized protein n=1 Tax=Sporothrix schenckii 1099-18 TaxID=1397361 RepID=A0A0F2MFG2_SPOSC|nr:uncharacterized protein SPSK_01633 [Sporothrix schenckii 1099-18]KJR86906.1 hypothetical protein SPSK_01633 [Sporothrix schenckii 1099-18]